MDKQSLSERDICTKFITPSLERAGWDIQIQIWKEVTLTQGRIIVKGTMHKRGRTNQTKTSSPSARP